jgi:hypothetical protein
LMGLYVPFIVPVRARTTSAVLPKRSCMLNIFVYVYTSICICPSAGLSHALYMHAVLCEVHQERVPCSGSLHGD